VTERTIEYFFTPSSPWTYLGHPRFYAIASCYDLAIQVKPCDLGRVFSVSGGLPLKQRAKQRQDYRIVELKRWRDYLGAPLELEPKYFPVPSDRASLAIIAVDLAHGTHAAMSYAHAVMRGCWADQLNIDDAATLADIARSTGLDPGSIEGDTLRDRAKARYAEYTQQAIDLGVFGAPWYVFEGEPFWGQDRLDLLERAVAR
jgi:2-hydroxychromene-2-carboxylate isomerase